MKSQAIYILLTLFLISSCANSPMESTQSIEKEINKIENSLLAYVHVKGQARETYNLKERMKYYNIPGVSIAVVRNGKLHWSKAYGLVNAEENTPVNSTTIFQVASASKPITALGILKLVEQKKIALDDEVNDYLKGWQIQENEFTKTEKVTIRRLLTHTAGLGGHGFDGYTQTDNFPTIVEVLNGKGNSQKITVENTPGATWRYSGGGYVILQKLIEDVTGQSFEDYMDKEILKPLKMNNSTYGQPLDKKLYKNVSSAHDNDGNVINGGWHNYPEKGAGGLWSTPEDFAKYFIEIQNIIDGKENGILSKETIDMMLTKDLNNWGLGLLVEGSGKTLRFQHDGKNEGFVTDFLAFANKGDAVIIMTNGNTSSLKDELLKSISSYYSWDTHNQKIIDIKDIPTEELKRFSGRYSWTERPWVIEVILREGKLNFVGSGFPINILSPYGQYDFIDVESGVEVKFNISDSGRINGLTWRERFEFDRIE